MVQTNTLQQFGQGKSRGFWAGGLGAPADMGNALLNLLIAGGGYAGHKTGLLDRPPDLLGPPVGGSEWIAERMPRGGLLAGAKPDVSRPVNALMRLAESPANGKIAWWFADANASKFVGRDAPKLPQRDFSLDYQNQANLGPVGSRLTHDVDGYPLGTGPIAGRRTVGGLDEAQGSSNALDIARAFGVPVETVPAAQIRPDVGRISSLLGRWEPGTAPTPYADPRILVAKELKPAGFDRTVSHEIGHLIDKMAGYIKQDGISSELGRLYSDLNTRGWVSKWQKGAKPQDFKYVGDDIKRELMAEAVHAYRTSPNYIKSVAPNTAAAIREAARNVDGLNKHNQFNSLAPAAGAGLLGAGLFANDDSTNALR